MLDLIKLQVSPPSSKQGRETSSARSARAEERNPILALPAAARLAELSEKEREPLVAILLAIKTDATARANVCWKEHTAPMARSEERRVGQAGVSTCRSRWSQNH